MAACGAAACTSTPQPPVARTNAMLRFHDPALACDDNGHVYVAGAERFATHTQIFVSSSERYGESWNPSFQYVNHSRDGDRGRPQLVAGASGEVYALWEDTRHGRIQLFFNRSLDGGSTWLPNDVHIGDEHAGVTRIMDPALRADRRGNVYVVWRDDREGFPAYYVKRSRDRGETWAGGTFRITGIAANRKSAPRVVCDDNGGVYAAWVEEGRAGVFFNASTQYGEAWAFEPKRLGIALNGRVLRLPDLCVSETGVVVVAWVEQRSGRAYIQLARSESNGGFFEPVRTLEAGGGPWFEPSAPQIACDRFGNVYIAWQAMRSDGRWEFIVQSSRDDGRNFHEVRFPRGGDATFREFGATSRRNEPVPFRMRADHSGNVYFSWTEARTGVLRLGFDRLSDYGRTWLGLSRSLEHTGYTPLTLDAPLICADDYGHVYLLWSEGAGMTVASSPFYGDSGWRYEQF
jgi:hypothetical protein